MLTWHRENLKGHILGYVVALAILAVGFGLISLIQGDGLDMLTAWPIWIVIVLGAYLMSSPLNVRTDSAGARWFQSHYRRRWYQRQARVNYIKTYELVKVKSGYAGGRPQLYLEDGDGAAMYRFLWDLQPDRRTWDLVYNGILHSVANGAETDAIAEGLLKLADTPALRLRDTGDDG